MPRNTRPLAGDVTVTPAEYAAIDAAYATQLLCNAGGFPLDHGSLPHWRAVTNAGLAILRAVGFTPREARCMWDLMIDGGSGAEHAHHYMRENGATFRI